MTTPCRPQWSEAERLQALRRYAILDTPREPGFDAVVRLAAALAGTPMAAITLVDEGRQWFKAEHNLGVRETPLDGSICATAILEDHTLVVTDATQDPRFANHPLVTGPFGMRFYAGAPLVTPDGFPLGALCVIDTQVRPQGLTPEQVSFLETLADRVMAELELRLAVAERERLLRDRDEALTLANAQRAALELAVADAPAEEVLNVLIRAVEAQSQGKVAVSVLLVDEEQRLRHAAAPSLPTTFMSAIDGTRIGPAVGSCGTAAHRAEPVSVSDIENDPLWADFRDVALAHGLRSCWSQPILSSSGEVLGTLASYRRDVHEPSPREMESVAMLVSTAALVLDRQRQIREKKAIERALRHSEAHLLAIFERTAAGICEADLQGRIVRVNERFCQILQRPAAELLGMTMQQLTHPDDLPRNLELLDDMAGNGRPFQIEKRYLLPDGGSVWVSNTVSLIREEGEDGPAAILAVVIDITERRRAEEELRKANRRKDVFLAMLAHELRNPLAPIKAAAQILAHDQLDAQTVRRASRVVARQATHMAGLLDDLLDVSRVTRGLVALGRADVDMKRLVSEVAEQVAPLIEAKRHQLAIDLPSEPVHVLGDRTRLIQVFANLLNNAAKYTPPGGHIRFTMAVQGDEIVFSVQDDGVGIDPELQPHIFDLFVQEERSPDRSQGGLGLGLSLARSLVELHGGRIRCRSEGKGRGSEFTVTLPLLRVGPAAPQETPDEAAAAGVARRRVLLVDDNADAAQMLALLLESMGHETQVASDWRSALDLARSQAPDVCILDIGLPEVDGYQLARRLRALPQTAGATLIALTGYGQAQDRRRAAQAGFDHHVVKPAEAAHLATLFDQRRYDALAGADTEAPARDSERPPAAAA